MKLRYQELQIHDTEIKLPASKSISNRALIIQKICTEKIELINLSEAMDTQTMLSQLNNKSLKKDVGIAGTVARFLTTVLSIEKASYIIIGDERMQQRPMQILLDALQELGTEINYLGKKGFLPLKINGSKTKGGILKLKANISSQFVSALMMIAPNLENGLTINLEGQISSKPYIEMTKSIMEYFGAKVEFKNNIIEIKAQKYKSNSLKIEGDWSGASYFYSALALVEEGSLLLKNLNSNSWQGDNIVADIYYRLGIKTTTNGDDMLLEKSDNIINYLEYDFSDCPDLAQSVICTCVGLGIEGKFTGLHTLRNKETDRIQALQNELKKINWVLEEDNENYFELKRSPIKENHSLIFKTYNDHRMAMAFAPLAIVFGEIEIESPQVVEKSFPNFWLELKKLGLN